MADDWMDITFLSFIGEIPSFKHTRYYSDDGVLAVIDNVDRMIIYTYGTFTITKHIIGTISIKPNEDVRKVMDGMVEDWLDEQHLDD